MASTSDAKKSIPANFIQILSEDDWLKVFIPLKSVKTPVVAAFVGYDRVDEAESVAREAVDYPNIQFLVVDMSGAKRVAETYRVEMAPTFLFFKEGKEVRERIELDTGPGVLKYRVSLNEHGKVDN